MKAPRPSPALVAFRDRGAFRPDGSYDPNGDKGQPMTRFFLQLAMDRRLHDWSPAAMAHRIETFGWAAAIGAGPLAQWKTLLTGECWHRAWTTTSAGEFIKRGGGALPSTRSATAGVRDWSGAAPETEWAAGAEQRKSSHDGTNDAVPAGETGGPSLFPEGRP